MPHLFYKIIVIASIVVLLAPAQIIPVAYGAPGDGTDVVGACSDGSCSPKFTSDSTDVFSGNCAGGGCGNKLSNIVPGANGPTETLPTLAGEPVHITNRWVGIASPVLNAIARFTGLTLGQKKFEWDQTFILEALKKRILDMMVDEIIRWIQGGDSPKFITDWQQFLTDAGNNALGELATRVGAAGLCQPFKSSILQSLLVPEPQPFGGSLYGSSITCTLDDIVDNIDDFYEDFSKGGWQAYNSSWQIQNNPISVFILTESAKAEAISSAQEAAKLQGLTGGGYLSQQTCHEPDLFPGQQNTPALGSDLDGDGNYGDIASTCRITTPGSTIGALVAKAVGSDIDFIVNSQQLATYIAAISDALWNRLIRDGVGGLARVSTRNSPGSDTPNNFDDDFIPDGANGCLSLDGELQRVCENYQESNNGNFDITRSNLLANIQIVKDELNELRLALVEWKEVADELSTFITTESADKPATCIATALEPFFPDPTPAGVAAYAASIDAQIQTVDDRLVALKSSEDQLIALDLESWAEFTVLASTIQTQLSALAVPDDALDEAQIQTANLDSASDDIKQDLLTCNSFL
ncbi:MAG: hypothetical protein Q7R62_02950 [bacterium]|nr:hypothetical protein [bacterium]